MKAYGNFAAIYDELMDDIDYKKWYQYIEDIIEKSGKKPKTILEMACGTGNLTEYLCKANYKVTCFDLSEEMLTVAYDKLSGYRNVNILKQDMRDLSLGDNKYDLIIAACDSINYITEGQDLLKVFENAYQHLEEGGLFIFDINSHYKLSNIIGDNIFIEDNEDIFYIWDNEFDEQQGISCFYLTFFVKDGDCYKRFDEIHKERAYRSSEVLEKLEQSKFKTIKTYDEFTFNKVRKDSQRIFFVASK